MSVQAIIPITLNGEKYFTHTSWFSEKQYNAWTYIPTENKHLAFYYSLSVVSLVGIFFRKTSIIKNVFSSYGKLFTGVGGSLAVNYFGWFSALKMQESGQIERVIIKNECGSTPLWLREDQVVNLRDRDYQTFMSRRDGRKYTSKDVSSYNPDGVLVGNGALEKLV